MLNFSQIVSQYLIGFCMTVPIKTIIRMNNVDRHTLNLCGSCKVFRRYGRFIH